MDDALSAEAAMVQERPGRLREFWFYFRENRGAVIGLWIFAVFAFLALFGPWVAPMTQPSNSAPPPYSPPRGKRAAAGPISWVPIRSGAICCRV